MTIEGLFEDPSIKNKAKAKQIGEWLLSDELPIDELLAFTESQNEVNKATCIEAIEYATKKRPEIGDETLLNFITKCLVDKAPRIKWESAKVIGNIARLYPNDLNQAVDHLLSNASHKGTVVRWATAYALAEILKLETSVNEKLLPQINQLCDKEEDSGVRKKYIDALKKINREK